MEIQVRGNGVRINDGLREFIDRRATRLDRMLDRVVDAKLELRALHNRVGPDTTAAQMTIRAGVPEPELISAIDEIELDDEQDVGDLVRTKRFEVKPMDVEEAIEQMELLGHDFFLFHYVDEDIPSVVYRRRDGAYGLLIPKGG